MAVVDQPLHQRDAVVIGMRHHLVPVAAEVADVFGVVGMHGEQLRLGLFPGAAAILLDVPGRGADIVEEPFALRFVGDQPAEGQVGIVVDQHLADVEDDVADFGHAGPFNVCVSSRPEWQIR